MVRKADAKYSISAEDRTRQGIQSAESRLQRFGRAITDRLVIPIDSVLRALGRLPRAFTDAFRRISDAERRAVELQTSLEDIAELDLVGARLGVSTNLIINALERLDETIAQAQEGTGEAAQEFDKLGVSAERLGRIDDATDRLAAFADELQRVADPRIRSAILQNLAGEGLGPLVFGGGAPIRAAAQQARALGLTTGLGAPQDVSRVREAFADLFAVISKGADDVARAGGAEAVARAVEAVTDAIRGEGLEAILTPRSPPPPPQPIPGLQQEVRLRPGEQNEIARNTGRTNVLIRELTVAVRGRRNVDAVFSE